MSRPSRVRVPWRVITSSHYNDATVLTYVKVAGLGQRPQGCEASVAYLTSLLGLSRSTVERGLTQLMRPAPDDDVVELTSWRRTLPGGRGTTAVRRVRRPGAAEHGAWVPTRAAEALSPRQLRAYAAISYAVATGHPLTLGELGQILRHRSGKSAETPLTTRSVRRLLAGLVDLGWIGMEQRAGYRGRHTYTVHDEPVQQSLDLTGDSEEGSAADLGDGSLATEEDPQTDSPDDECAGGSIRRRREQVVARGPVDNPLPSQRRAYTGPALSLAPRIWQVLEPVHSLLPGLSPYVARALAREVGRQLDTGVEPAQIRARLEARFACTETIRDPGRWLLGAAVVHRGCGRAVCESGTNWRTGERCPDCQPAPTAAAPGPEPAASSRPPSRPRGPTRPNYPGPTYPSPPRSWCSCPDCQPAPAGRRT
ncbi:hypothetical protein [Streptomyces sp. C10-9-1]|uniref:hypothetical protein n=1 Tax=Streptomyces sp. C10-9-1 TaxID=1859285 RepID=UPI003F4A7535